MTINVTVTNTAGTSATSTADQFTYEAVPTVTGLSTNTGPLAGGTQVILTGMNFVGVTGVKFGTVAASFTYNTPTQITALAPVQSAAGAVNVYVTTTVGTSTAATANVFTYTGSTTTGTVPAMPTLPNGYTKIYTQQFPTTAAMGTAFANAYPDLAQLSYSGPNTNFGSGINSFDTAETCFVAPSTGGGGNSLYYYMTVIGGTSITAACCPGLDSIGYYPLFFGQWGVCARLVYANPPTGYLVTNSAGAAQYGMHFLLWPTTGAWTNEVDHPDNPGDGPLTENIECSSLITGDMGNFSSTANKVTAVNMTDGDYHYFSINWVNANEMQGYADGTLVTTFTNNGQSDVPNQQMRVSLQCEAQSANSGAIALLEIAWIYIYQS